jgi:8-oxo-dGTP pyrophosphatase MutT (NUDIX family)
MISRQVAKDALKEIVWEEGKIVPVVDGPYRHRIVVLCSSLGSQEAQFANGRYKYFCHMQCLSNKEQWNERGGLIVPVLPDGRIVMTVQQRSTLAHFPERPTIAEIKGQRVDLAKFGPYSSLEFPGGGVDPGEGLKVGILRELAEETGVKDQTALYYHRYYPVYAFSSDVAGQNFLGVAFLSGLTYEERVESDGGMEVLALSRNEVELNMRKGVIHAGNGAFIIWSFYRDVEAARTNPDLEKEFIQSGYLLKEQVKIAP